MPGRLRTGKTRRSIWAFRSLKKNGTGLTRSRYLQIITQFLGLSAREGLLLTVGQVADLQTLEIARRGLKRKEDG